MTTPYRNGFLIYNPQAAQLRRNPQAIERCLEILKSRGDRFTPTSTVGPGSATLIAKQAIQAEADVVLVAGGDGTVNEAVNGIAHSGVPLGVLPAGTANGFAAEAGIPKQILQAVEDLPRWLPRRISLGLHSAGAEGPRFFLLLCGIGLDALVIRKVHLGFKAALGKAAFLLTGLSLVGSRLPEFHVRIGDRVYVASLAVVSRIRNYGGDRTLAQTVSLLDKKFEVVLFSGTHSLTYVKYLLAFVTGRIHHVAGVTAILSREVEVAPFGDATVYSQVDGECVGPIPTSLKIVDDALIILLPPEYPTGTGPAHEQGRAARTRN